jgi:UDP-N-acetyl-D-glucosamine dehydrogenase
MEGSGMTTMVERLRAREARVAVVGQGYVGLVLAVHAAEAGFETVGFELDAHRAASLRAGKSYIEDISDERLRAVTEGGFRPTDDPADLDGFDVGVISVPTPLHEGAPDLRAVEAAALTLGKALGRGSLVILESTTYPGTTEELVRPVLEQSSGLVAGEDFLLGYSPERIDPGNTANTLKTTPKVVSGIDQASLEVVAEFFKAFVGEVVPVSTTAVGELTKLIENTFRHVNIALVNELARFAHDLDVDIWEAIDAASTKPFGYMPFRPGPGVGGHCLPVDPTYLSWKVKRQTNEAFRFVELANDVNDHMPLYVVQRIQALLNEHERSVKGSSITVLGLAYKPNTADARETPAIPIVAELVRLGAKVTVIDPLVRGRDLGAGVDLVTDPAAQGLEDADLVVLVTDHDVFDYHDVVHRGRLILDTRNRLPRADHVARL